MSTNRTNRSSDESSGSTSDQQFRQLMGQWFTKNLSVDHQIDDNFENKENDTNSDLKDTEVVVENILEDLRFKSLTNKELISGPLIAPTSEPNPKIYEVRQQSFSKEFDSKEAKVSTSRNSTLIDSTSSESTSSNATLIDFSQFGSTSSSSTSSDQISSDDTLIDFSLFGSTSSDSTSSSSNSGALDLSTELSTQPLENSMTNTVIASIDVSDHQMIASLSKESESIVSNQSKELVSNPIERLQQICTKNGWPLPSYYIVREEGLPHKRVFTIGCVLQKCDFIGTGVANTKRLAKRKAAQNMIEGLNDDNQLRVVVLPLNSV